jgi:hypothetical protein
LRVFSFLTPGNFGVELVELAHSIAQTGARIALMISPALLASIGEGLGAAGSFGAEALGSGFFTAGAFLGSAGAAITSAFINMGPTFLSADAGAVDDELGAGLAGDEGSVAAGSAAMSENAAIAADDVGATSGPYSVWDSSGGFLGMVTDVSPADFAANLVDNGYTAVAQMGPNGPIMRLVGNTGSYTFYARSSTSQIGAQYFGPGPTLKYNLP